MSWKMNEEISLFHQWSAFLGVFREWLTRHVTAGKFFSESLPAAPCTLSYLMYRTEMLWKHQFRADVTLVLSRWPEEQEGMWTLLLEHMLWKKIFLFDNMSAQAVHTQVRRKSSLRFLYHVTFYNHSQEVIFLEYGLGTSTYVLISRRKWNYKSIARFQGVTLSPGHDALSFVSACKDESSADGVACHQPPVFLLVLLALHGIREDCYSWTVCCTSKLTDFCCSQYDALELQYAKWCRVQTLQTVFNIKLSSLRRAKYSHSSMCTSHKITEFCSAGSHSS